MTPIWKIIIVSAVCFIVFLLFIIRDRSSKSRGRVRENGNKKSFAKDKPGLTDEERDTIDRYYQKKH